MKKTKLRPSCEIWNVRSWHAFMYHLRYSRHNKINFLRKEILQVLKYIYSGSAARGEKKKKCLLY